MPKFFDSFSGEYRELNYPGIKCKREPDRLGVISERMAEDRAALEQAYAALAGAPYFASFEALSEPSPESDAQADGLFTLYFGAVRSPVQPEIIVTRCEHGTLYTFDALANCGNVALTGDLQGATMTLQVSVDGTNWDTAGGYNVSPRPYLFQDEAGSMPATEIGQPVARMDSVHPESALGVMLSLSPKWNWPTTPPEAPKTDADGFIEWKGGELPHIPGDNTISFKYRNGVKGDPVWTKDEAERSLRGANICGTCADDIVAYRIEP